MAILLKDVQLVSYQVLMAAVPNEYLLVASTRAKICASCKQFSHVSKECTQCDCTFKTAFYTKEAKCKLKYW